MVGADALLVEAGVGDVTLSAASLADEPEFIAPPDATLEEITAVCRNLLREMQRVFFKAGSIRNPVAVFETVIAIHEKRPRVERREFMWAIMHELRRITFAADPVRILPNFSVVPTRLPCMWGTPFR